MLSLSSAQRGRAMALVTVGWPSIPGLGEPAFSSWAPRPVLWGGSTRSCFLGKQQWTLFSQSHISQILIFACWPSSLQLFPTADHFLCTLLAASDVPALLGSQPPGLRQMQSAAIACGLGLWLESTAGSLGKSGCTPPLETSGLKPGWTKQLHKNLWLLYFFPHFWLLVELLVFCFFFFKGKSRASKKRKVIKGKGLFLELLQSKTVSLTSNSALCSPGGFESLISLETLSAEALLASWILVWTLSMRSALDFLSLFCFSVFWHS